VKQALDPLLVPLQAQTSVTPKLLSMKASVGDLYSHLLYLYSFIFIVSGSILVSFHFLFRFLFCFFDSTGFRGKEIIF
jgi:hypothetical protein